MPRSVQSDILRSVFEASMPEVPPARPGTDTRDYLTISDTSVETFDKSTFATLSALETISLETSVDGETINPDSYDSQDEDAGDVKPEWLIIGQPDHLLSDATALEEDNNHRSAVTDPDSLDLDFNKQKKFAEIHVQRRLRSIKRYLENMEFCDLSLQFGSSTTPVHATMFRMHEGFVGRFPGLVNEIQKPMGKTRQLDVYGDVTVPALGAIMNFVYDGQCQVTYENLAEVVTAVEFFGIAALEEEIMKVVESVMLDTNLLSIIFQGDSDHPLHEVAWARLLERITFVAKLGDYIALELGEMCKILSSDGLAVRTEREVFEMAIHWINADRLTRTVHFNKVISCVRFHFMTAEELSYCQREEELLTTSTPIADMVALAYIARPFILENELTFLENFELLPPRNLDVLRHFTAFKEQQLSPLSERAESYQAFYEGDDNTNDTKPVRFEWGKKEVKEPVPAHLDGVTLEGLGDLPENKVEYVSMGRSSGESRKTKAKSDPRTPSHLRKMQRERRLPTVQGGLSQRFVGGVLNSSTDGSPSFSDMTFNDNGSLVTKRGGKETHRTLNRAFERIYRDIPCSR